MKIKLISEDAVSRIFEKMLYDLAVRLNDAAAELNELEDHFVSEPDVLSRAKLLRQLNRMQENLTTHENPTKTQLGFTRGYCAALGALRSWALEQDGVCIREGEVKSG